MKFKKNIVAYLLSIAMCFTIVGAAALTLEQVKELITQTEQEIVVCEENKEDAHSCADILRTWATMTIAHLSKK